MALRKWVRLPPKWIEDEGLKMFRWCGRNPSGSDQTAALMVLMAIAHHAEDETGIAKLTYDQLSMATGLSRTKISAGLNVLETRRLIQRLPKGRSTVQIMNYDPKTPGWCMMPARRLYSPSGEILALKDFTLRKPTELHALKLYFLFAARRGRDTNMANISFEKIEEYSGIGRNHIKSGVSLLAAIGLVYVEHLPSKESEYGIANAYRLAHLEPRNHMGTKGRGRDNHNVEEEWLA